MLAFSRHGRKYFCVHRQRDPENVLEISNNICDCSKYIQRACVAFTPRLLCLIYLAEQETLNSFERLNESFSGEFWENVNDVNTLNPYYLKQ